MIRSPGSPHSARRSLVAGLAAGAIAAVAASLVSLNIHSPDGAFFNSASVTIGALLAGQAGGAIWQAAQGSASPRRMLALNALTGFTIVAALAVLGEHVPGMQISGLVRFVLPLAALVFVFIAALTPFLARLTVPAIWLGPVAAVAAIIVGVSLAGQAKVESGRLALPATSSVNLSSRSASSSTGRLTATDVAGKSFAIVPDKSTATYTVHEKLAQAPLPSDAVGKTSAISGAIYLDGRASTITVDLRTLQSDQQLRDTFIRDRGSLKTSQHPYAVFTVSGLSGLPAEYQEGQAVTSNVAGTMSINDVQKPVTFAVEARLEAGVLTIHGTTDFTWDDFQIPAPNLAGFVQVDNTAHIEVLLVAKEDGSGTNG